MVPVIFLDIDGVLNIAVGRRVVRSSWGRTRSTMVRQISPDAVANLNELCQRSGALLVVSSSWRLEGDVRPILLRHGATGSFHADWSTDTGEGSRGDQIDRWLAAHGQPQYVVVDDWMDGLQRHFERVVATNYRTGLLASDVEAALTLLGGAVVGKPGEQVPQSWSFYGPS